MISLFLVELLGSSELFKCIALKYLFLRCSRGLAGRNCEATGHCVTEIHCPRNMTSYCVNLKLL